MQSAVLSDTPKTILWMCVSPGLTDTAWRFTQTALIWLLIVSVTTRVQIWSASELHLMHLESVTVSMRQSLLLLTIPRLRRPQLFCPLRKWIDCHLSMRPYQSPDSLSLYVIRVYSSTSSSCSTAALSKLYIAVDNACSGGRKASLIGKYAARLSSWNFKTLGRSALTVWMTIWLYGIYERK